tara:strand:- start:84 stop:494 length:411 start_codon:yes stop_codon:yes gene_type:complete
MSTVGNHPYKNPETGGYQMRNLPENPFPTTDTAEDTSNFYDLNNLDADQVRHLRSMFRSGGGGGATLEQIRSMMMKFFSNPWTPVGYGWGGTNSDAVRINRSQASKSGFAHAGNKSSFNRSGSRLNPQGTPWKSTL